MRNQQAIQERYLQDGLPTRLGGLAANLARISSFSSHADHKDIVEGLVEESKFFIEWAAPGASLEAQARLVELQRLLAQWHLSWDRIWADPVQRAAVAEQAQSWSQQVLEMSGLLG
jgi:hypothetical protein